MAKLEYNSYTTSHGLLVLISAANTGEAITFEGGEKSLVCIKNSNGEALSWPLKLELFHKVSTAGFESITSVDETLIKSSVSRPYTDFFYYKTYTKPFFCLNAPNVSVLFKDGTKETMSISISPPSMAVTAPLNEEDDEEFTRNGGTISEGFSFCTLT